MALNSFSFVLIAVLAVLACRLWAPRLIREAVTLLLSFYFLSTYLSDGKQVALLCGFLALVFAVGFCKARSTSLWPATVSFAIVISFWIGLFLLKDPDLFKSLNPFNGNPIRIIGISYIVFRGMTFVLEVAPGDRINVITFVNYMLFFPTLLAGPIERYQRFDASTAQQLPWDASAYHALNRVLNGFIKKFVIADNLMELGIFSMTAPGNDFSTPMLWIGALLMLTILLLDFSGYCDIVIGIAALMGFKLVENFNFPLMAKNLQDFWSRWHMSLGSVIQDYVFSPLSKVVITRMGREQQMYGIASIYVIAMVLVAMWHGTTWGFLIFGMLQGAVLFAIQIRREWARARAKALKIKFTGQQTTASLWFGRVSTYLFVSLTMIWWQGTVPEALKTYQKLAGW